MAQKEGETQKPAEKYQVAEYFWNIGHEFWIWDDTYQKAKQKNEPQIKEITQENGKTAAKRLLWAASAMML